MERKITYESGMKIPKIRGMELGREILINHSLTSQDINTSEKLTDTEGGEVNNHSQGSKQTSEVSPAGTCPDINFLKQKKIEVDKKIAEIRKGYHGYRNMDNPKCNEYLLCIKLQATSKALSLGIEVCENIVKQNERLEKCSICKRVFWDKRCPDCIREILDKQMKEILEKIDKCKKYFPGDRFMFETEDGKYIRWKELKAQLKGDKK